LLLLGELALRPFGELDLVLEIGEYLVLDSLALSIGLFILYRTEKKCSEKSKKVGK
jgi:hypothetical protein